MVMPPLRYYYAGIRDYSIIAPVSATIMPVCAGRRNVLRLPTPEPLQPSDGQSPLVGGWPGTGVERDPRMGPLGSNGPLRVWPGRSIDRGPVCTRKLLFF